MRTPFDRDLCGHCGRWREEHYDNVGAWIEGQPCDEYAGVSPAPDRAKKKDAELAKALNPE